MPGSSFDEVFARLREGKMVVMVPEESDAAEGDLVMGAEFVTPDHVNFMAREARGIVSIAIPEKRMRELGIPLSQTTESGPVTEQAGALVEAREGVTTGISAADRARTIQVIANPKSTTADIVMPGHILPLMALTGGVMMRLGRAEGAVDLMKCAGMRPAAALCAILDDNGEMATLPTLREFAARHDLPIVCHPRSHLASPDQ